MAYDRRSNINYYPQPMIANTYREVRARISWEQYQKLSELCGQTGCSQSEILRRLINVCTPELIKDVTGIVPARVEAVFDNPLEHIEGMCPVCGLFECNCPM